METSANIVVSKKTAQRFEAFSRSQFQTNSETLEILLDFFQEKKLSPDKNPELTIPILEKVLGRKLNIIIAILKNVEKTQTRPTLALLTALLEQPSAPSPKIVEKKVKSDEDNYWTIK